MNSEILNYLPGSSKMYAFTQLQLLMINTENREDCEHLFKCIFYLYSTKVQCYSVNNLNIMQ